MEFRAPIKVFYGWMEGWGLAAHGVYISGRAGSLLDGFEDGGLLRAASGNETPPPPGCGNATTVTSAPGASETWGLRTLWPIAALGTSTK